MQFRYNCYRILSLLVICALLTPPGVAAPAAARPQSQELSVTPLGDLPAFLPYSLGYAVEVGGGFE